MPSLLEWLTDLVQIGISEPSGLDDQDDPEDVPPRRAVVHETDASEPGDDVMEAEGDESAAG